MIEKLLIYAIMYLKDIDYINLNTYQEDIPMHVEDTVKKEFLELDTKGLIQKMIEGRQVDVILKEKQTDDVGYLTWDIEHWSTVNGERFIRCYSLEGRVLKESTGHNIYDLANDFKPEEAAKVQLS